MLRYVFGRINENDKLSLSRDQKIRAFWDKYNFIKKYMFQNNLILYILRFTTMVNEERVNETLRSIKIQWNRCRLNEKGRIISINRK